jgi:anaerobic selenocysteine-containing dehydrogenase
MQSGEPVDAVPNYIPPVEVGANGELARYPINLVSPKSHAFLNSQYANEPYQQGRQGEQRVVIHPRDAARRGIGPGDYVRVFNDRGAFEGRAEVNEDVIEGLAMASLGYWPSLTRNGSAVNSTTSSRHCNLGGAGTQSDNRVEIAKV